MAAPEHVVALAGGARVVFTAKAHGSLSLRPGEHEAGALRARRALGSALGLDALAFTRQVHGALITRRRRGALDAAPEADGQVTTESAVGLVALTADCLPIALACEGSVAIVHAGWRGLAAGVIERGVLAMRALSPAAPLGAAIGPGAGGCCYEVRDEVRAALGEWAALGAGGDGREGGPATVDLQAIAAARLRAAGVQEVQAVGLCTVCDERFFSHRREGARAGRQGAIVWRASS
ncbi:MAG: polyphenol oxidase family protein [Solirubrobacteraceae bacterium]